MAYNGPLPQVVNAGGSGAATLTGLLTGNGTSAFTGTPITQYNVITGGASNVPNSVAPGNSGIPLISQGAAAQPIFGTATVPGGGSGSVSFNINGPVISNTTTTGALSSVTLTNQQLLVGNTSAAPTAKTFQVVVQVFTSTGTYTPTSGMVYCTIEVVGGGGGSGGCATTGASSFSVAAGGGGGGYARKTVTAATIGSSQSVTIGAGGLAGTAGNNAGGTGGTSSVGSIVSATGGSGGSGGAALTAGGVTGSAAGGVGSSGDFNATGGPAIIGICGSTAQNILIGGSGGCSYFGGGAIGTSATGATAGNIYGGGAGGGSNYFNTSQIAGAAGAKGFVVITEYVLS